VPGELEGFGKLEDISILSNENVLVWGKLNLKFWSLYGQNLLSKKRSP
jgi:hypothetical protein